MKTTKNPTHSIYYSSDDHNRMNTNAYGKQDLNRLIGALLKEGYFYFEIRPLKTVC